jgi:hypothetical protein
MGCKNVTGFIVIVGWLLTSGGHFFCLFSFSIMRDTLLKLLLVVTLFCPLYSFSQPQLVLLKKENVLKRYYPGDDFVFRLKGSKTIRKSYVNNLSDTAVITHRDTIPFHKIDQVYHQRSRFYNTIGGVLVAGGTGYFLVDQINNKFDFDRGVTSFSATTIAIGLPLALYSPKWQRLNRKFRLMTVSKGSGFYRPDPRNNNSFFQN